MAYQLGNFNSATVGNNELYVAKMLDVGSKSTKPIYDNFLRVDGFVNMSANANGEIESDYADDGVHEAAATQGTFDLSTEVTGLSEAGFGLVFGRYLPVSGGAALFGAQNPPSLAIAWQTTKANGKRVRHIAYNVKYPEAEFNSSTRAEGIEFQHITLNGQGAGILYRFTGTDRATGETVEVENLKHFMMDEESDAFNSTIWNNWFTAVQYPEGVAADLPDLTTYTFAKGANTGETKVTFTYAAAVSFVYKLGSPGVVRVGDTVPAGIAIVSGADVAVTTGQVITVYALDASGKAIAGESHTMAAGEIK